jgi:site-specific DNA-methyltransferase (adenine-specific)
MKEIEMSDLPRIGQSQTVVDIGMIYVEDGRGRKDFSRLGEIMDSIKRFGVLQPVVLSKARLEDGKHKLIAGETRLRACTLLGWTQIPCTFREDLSEVEHKEAELEENLVRKDLEWTEEVELVRQIDALKRVIHGDGGRGLTGGWTAEKTAALVGQTPASISTKLSLAQTLLARPDLKKAVQDMPMTVASRVIRQRLEGEDLARQQAQGLLKVDSRLLLGNCLELIKDVPDESVDLLVTDPPFGNPVIASVEGDNMGDNRTYTSDLKPSDNLGKAEVEDLFARLTPDLCRVMKPGGHLYVFFGYECYAGLWLSLGKRFLVNPVPLTWYKKATTSPFLGYDYSPCSEPIFFGCRPGPEGRGRRLNSPGKTLLEFKPIHASAKVHVFEKPQELLRYLIEQSSQPGETVFDPFAGSGSTLLAGQALGRRVLGFELDPSNWRLAQARLIENQSKETTKV